MTMHINFKRFLALIVVTMLLAYAPILSGSALENNDKAVPQENAGPFMCLTELPSTSSYPNVQINFRMFDPSYSPITSVTDHHVRISENGRPAVSLSSNLQINATKGGIDFYFVVDRSNRIDPLAVRAILQEFANYYQEGVDTVTIYTDTNNTLNQYYPSPNFNSLTQAIANFPEKSEDNMRTIDDILYKLSTQFIDKDFCTAPRAIYFMLGDATFKESRSGRFSEIAKTSHARMALLHFSNPRNGKFEYKALYESSISNAGGIYKQVLAPKDDATAIFDQLLPYRQVYTASYRTNNGESGTHTLQAEYQGTQITTSGQNSYSINLLPPKISLSAETVIPRNALEKVDGGFSYDKNSQDITVNVTWPDGYPRELDSAATLIIIGQTAKEERIPIALSKVSSNIYKFPWNFSPLQERGQYDFAMSLEVSDEFGTNAKADPGLQISVLNTVNPAVYFKAFNWLLYVMAGLVITSLLAIVILWRRLGKLAQGGVQAIGKIAGEIRKTLVGGKRGKALAVLKVLDGPASLIGQELKIFTERVSLGRDPKLSDLTFYTPDTNSSVSGLHAIIERVNGSWRLVAVSQSRSETFVDDNAIPFDDPVYINPGQKVRLGYPAQQPVLFEFQTPTPRKTETSTDPRKTEVEPKTTPVGVIKIDKDKEQKLKQDASQEKDSIFDEYLK